MFQYAKIILVSCGLSLLIHSTFVQSQAVSSQSASSLGGLPVGTVSRFGLNGNNQFLTSLGNAKVGTSERQVLPFVPIPWWLTAPNFYYRPRPIAVRPIASRPTIVRPGSRPTSGVSGRGGGGIVENNNSLLGLDLGGLLGGLLGGVGVGGGIFG
ncbi:uncharacterized protein [Parasteatoda tepidariorum]|uniref:uncharacterized protein n=1 Tax=Parasteatoda tepidariorum TaxID=114398 RepID=UPI00077F8AE5|nr:uncharacterized protein LOC107456934 [Parasteatoda tepidariorum]